MSFRPKFSYELSLSFKTTYNVPKYVHMTCNIQSESISSQKSGIATLNFVYDIDSMIYESFNVSTTYNPVGNEKMT